MSAEDNYNYVISYGKVQVPVYRVYARPLTGVTPVPESSFTGRENILLAAQIDVEVFGENFLPSYTKGDNSMVVATDTMKNFILRQALAFEGSTLEGFLEQLGHQFLATYPEMERLQMTGRELPFTPAQVPQGGQAHFGSSNVLFSRSHDDYATATMDFASDGGTTRITAHRCSRVGMQLFKVTGSAFTHFVRDAYTTLPERGDRPLFISLDVHWKYADVADMQTRYIPSEQVRDVAQTVFHEFVSESIQHLVHEMGLRLLGRFPQMAEVSFKGNNLTRDPVGASETDPKQKVYSDPFPAYGLIKLTMSRKAEASGRK
jgi:urate oxidase